MRTDHETTDTAALLGALGLGAALMFFLDPSRGRRRRALVRDQVLHAVRKGEHGVEATVNDLTNRAHGLAAEARNRFREDDPTDDVLVARVRSELGRVCSHPRAVIVTALDGVVTLSGPVLDGEVDNVLAAARSARGVVSVENRLEVHEHPGNVPSLQGGLARTGTRMELLQEHWTPAARLLVGTGGAALAGYGLSRRDTPGHLLGLLGAAALARSITNTDFRASRRRGGDDPHHVRKGITIAAPIDEVYRFFSDYQNFPAFMSHVREVEDRGDGRSHWTVDGPAGTHVSWDAELTAMEPERRIAWRSLPGATVPNEGSMTFESLDGGRTHVEIELDHRPPAGALGAAVATLFRRDPKHQLEDDLVRAKTFLETGHRPRDASRPASDIRNHAMAER
ncbi:MAG TPA: SRPBCC family protein [Gemmatimonadaceae bacterium]|nr:SRPBCC family protein [Gemmatimonadaceae bacterium]